MKAVHILGDPSKIQIKKTTQMSPWHTQAERPIVAQANAVSSSSQTTPPSPSGAANTIQISSVVSLANPTVAMVGQLPTVANVLKPWTRSHSVKQPAISAQMLHGFNLYSLHKCMEPNCKFARNVDAVALAHFRWHDESRPAYAAAGRVPTWLECAYCDLLAGSADELVRHTVAVHRSSIFLCPFCYYRSCAATNVLQHQQSMHREQTPSVLVAPGKAKALSAELQNIYAARGLHVPQLQCVAGCSKRFYTLDAYEKHLYGGDGHGDQLTCALCADTVPIGDALKHQLERHQIGQYACVNCAYGTSSVDELRHHMWRQHPTKLPYAMSRVSRDIMLNVSIV